MKKETWDLVIDKLYNISTLLTSHDSRFDTLDHSLTTIDIKLGEVDQRLSHVEKRLEKVELRLTIVEERLDQVEYRLDLVEQRLSIVEKRLDQVEHRLDQVEQRLTKVEKRLDKVELGQSNLETIALEHKDTMWGLSASIIQGFAELNQKLDGHHRKSVTQTADILESILEIREIKRNTGII